jgi:phosphinothricin acetyltransferase
VEIQPLRPADWPAVRAIYEAGIATGDATFETAAPTWEAWDAAHLPGHRLLATDGDRVLGWAALAPVSDRCAYAGVAEDSIYFPENRASVRLHQACGFRVVGVRERIGRLHGRWRDVLLLERRSPRIT